MEDDYDFVAGKKKRIDLVVVILVLLLVTEKLGDCSESSFGGGHSSLTRLLCLIDMGTRRRRG
jgi:hypothetical protein